MRTLNVIFPSTNTKVVTIDADCVLVGFAVSGAQDCSLSRDKALIYTDYTAPPAGSLRTDDLLIATASAVKGFQLNIPMRKSEQVMVSISGMGTAQLFLEDIVT